MKSKLKNEWKIFFQNDEESDMEEVYFFYWLRAVISDFSAVNALFIPVLDWDFLPNCS